VLSSESRGSESRGIVEPPSGLQARSARLSAALVGLGCAASVLAFSGSAQALPLLTLSGSVRGLYGSAFGDPPLNPYGPGVGLRAGVTLPLALYLGASLDYFVGESDTIAGIDTSASLLQVLADVGYDAGLGPLTLRPSLGLGFAQSSLEADGIDTSDGNFVLSPGAELIIGLGLLSVSGEVRYNKVFADGDVDGLILGVGIGFSL
jgi:Outer membrane protein beta-barrel domain